MKGKILVIRGGAIGDFILTLPEITALRNQFPAAHLEVLGYPHIVQLAIAGGLVDRVQSIEARALAGFFARGGELAEDLADYFSEFDLIVSYLYDPDEIFQDNVGRCTGAQFIAAPHRPNEIEGIHASKVYLKPLERLTIYEADPVPRLQLSGDSASLEPRRSTLGGETGISPAGPLALHPGSGSERKNWPEARWAGLIQHLITSTRSNLLLIGGEAEGQRLERLSATIPPQRVSLARKMPLAELARLLTNCAGFIGHDSGIAHLAAAVGLPGLILWGDSAEAIWRPPSERMAVIRHPAGLGSLSLAEVVRVLHEVHWHRSNLRSEDTHVSG